MGVHSSRVRSALLPTVLAALLVWSAGEVLAAPAHCTGAGYTKDAKGHVIPPTMACTGGCADLSACPPTPTGTGNHVIWGPYVFCTCPGEPESNCCHLILRTGTPANPSPNPPFVSIGDCESQSALCPPGNDCTQLTGNGSPTTPYRHQCREVGGG
ncbi:MAG: hypothetical protein IT379_02940 [Deltaproteobacteria bacterium]|nr:hypothetical protein [Deltaproteobacteria bacterium]